MREKNTVKIVTIITSVILVLTALFAVTYALLTGETVTEDPNSYKTGLLAITAISKTENISLASTLPMSDENGIETEPYIFTITNVGNLDYNFDLKLLSTGDSNSNTVISPSFIKLQIDDGDVTTLSSSGGIIKENVTLKVGESLDVKLRVWLSIDTTNDQIGRTFTSRIVADGQAIYTETNSDITLAAHIASLYKPNDTATNNGVVYNLDTNNQLMKDVAGNIRYYGANTTYGEDGTTVTNELKNYVYFNCDTYPDTNCEPWRIIGVFGNFVKIIRHEPLGQYPFDTPTYSAYWNDSEIKTLLNSAYLNNENTSYYQYNSSNEAMTSIDVNFNTNKTGIKNNALSLIADTTYNLGALDQTIEIYVNEAYRLERGELVPDSSYQAEWYGKIGLPYPSDYGYAVNLKECEKSLNNYNDEACTNNNWVKILFGNTYNSFLMTSPDITETSAITSVATNGQICAVHVQDNLSIYPVLYLNANAKISAEGEGTYSNPYRILIQ